MAEQKAGTSSQHFASGANPAVAPSLANGKERPTSKSKHKDKGHTPPPEPKDSLREIVETVVFVVVLVLLLKSFVAEAFVIPTGSMAETLFGYQKMVTCPKCGHKFPVNCSTEVDPQMGPPIPVIGATCPNCRYHIDFRREGIDPSWTTGDRVLVAKFLYDLDVLGLSGPDRFQVVVFKFPEKPQKDYTPLNYIKRLIGLPRETIAIHYGKLYRYEGLNYDDEDRAIPRKDLWIVDNMHKDDERALELFKQGKFQILRKPPKQVLAEARLVFDNDHQPKDLIGKVPPRWKPEPDDDIWKVDNAEAPRVFQHVPGANNELAWLRYRHLIPTDPDHRFTARPELITDFMGYNTWENPSDVRRHSLPAENWVGDLMLEFNVDIRQGQGELVVDLNKGVDSFQASWDLTTGICTLSRKNHGKEEKLASQPTALKKPGRYTLRFANVDDRLLVWVDSALPFGDGVTYLAPKQKGPTESDLQPVSIGVRGADLTVSELKLWRDTYYTVNVNGTDAGDHVDMAKPDWETLSKLPVRTMYVQPGHYLCLGDNSPESSDGRMWGAVPQRLLLGRALTIYYPFTRIRRIE
jgi:signal peptidase I